MEAAPADGGGQVVDVADVEPVAVRIGPAERAGLEPRVRAEEVPPHELQLVVGDVAERAERRVERQQMVAALLEHQHRPARRGEHVGRGGPRGPGPDDDGIPLAHAFPALGPAGRAVRAPLTPVLPLPRRCSPGAGRRRGTRSPASRGGPGCRGTRARRTHPPPRARRAGPGTSGCASSRRSCSSPSTDGKSSPSAVHPRRYSCCQPTTGPSRSRSGMPREPSIRVRHASVSSGERARNSVEARIAARPARERAAGPDPGRVDGEGVEEAVDVLHRRRAHASTGMRRPGRDEPVHRRRDDRALGVGQEAHAADPIGAAGSDDPKWMFR